MAKRQYWQDDYWLLLMQIFLCKPVGVKPTYSRPMVSLALELHIHPQVLVTKMKQIASLDTPRIERFWQSYSNNPKKLKRAVRLLREMKGFGRADEFYEGVDINETWERDWQPLDGYEHLTPVVLTLVLDLYFRLTPATMVVQTPEVLELAKLVGIPADEVVRVLTVYQQCDPYLSNRRPSASLPASLLQFCKSVWQRYGNDDPEALASLASQLKEYYR